LHLILGLKEVLGFMLKTRELIAHSIDSGRLGSFMSERPGSLAAAEGCFTFAGRDGLGAIPIRRAA
jgi:hypothetical protein